MKINSVANSSSKQNFGLKIKKDDNFRNFIKYTQNDKWGCTPKQIAVFIKELEDMRIGDDGKDDVVITFDTIKQHRSETRIPVIETGVFFDTYEGDEIHTRTDNCISYTLKNSKNNTEIGNYHCVLSEKTLGDVLREVASDYANYYYTHHKIWV